MGEIRIPRRIAVLCFHDSILDGPVGQGADADPHTPVFLVAEFHRTTVFGPVALRVHKQAGDSLFVETVGAATLSP